MTLETTDLVVLAGSESTFVNDQRIDAAEFILENRPVRMAGTAGDDH